MPGEGVVPAVMRARHLLDEVTHLGATVPRPCRSSRRAPSRSFGSSMDQHWNDPCQVPWLSGTRPHNRDQASDAGDGRPERVQPSMGLVPTRPAPSTIHPWKIARDHRAHQSVRRLRGQRDRAGRNTELTKPPAVEGVRRSRLLGRRTGRRETSWSTPLLNRLLTTTGSGPLPSTSR